MPLLHTLNVIRFVPCHGSSLVQALAAKTCHEFEFRLNFPNIALLPEQLLFSVLPIEPCVRPEAKITCYPDPHLFSNPLPLRGSTFLVRDWRKDTSSAEHEP